MAQKIFSFNDYDFIAFDLDFTLLRYSINKMTPLIYDGLRRFLVEKKSYPSCLLGAELNIDFLQRGLVLDADKGNILKLAKDGTILQATHGTKRLTLAEIVTAYGYNKKWDIAMQFIDDPLSLWNGPLSLKIRVLLDYFDFSIGMLFAQIIDLIDAQAAAKQCPRPQTYGVYADIFEGLAELFNRHKFYDGESSYFKNMRKQPERYIQATCPLIINWLKGLRQARKFIVLVTSSQLEQADFNATHALGKNWQSLFDCVVYLAKKPAFFTDERPFLRVENMQEVPNSEYLVHRDLVLNCAYTRGNWQQLLRTFAHKKHKFLDDLRALYVGDNHLLDILIPARFTTNTDVVAICEELIAEQQSIAYDDRKFVKSNFWGSYFGSETDPTYWMHIISEYSKLCTPFLEYLAEKPVAHIFLTKKPGGFYM